MPWTPSLKAPRDPMFRELLSALLLLAVCVVIHSGGLVLLLRYIDTHPIPKRARLWHLATIIIRIAWWLTLLHLFQIVLWAFFYWAKECLPDWDTSLYFSGVSYSTLGYGDVVLPTGWRMLGPAEGLTGILMCGLSTGVFFAILHRLLEKRPRKGEA